MSLRVLTHPDDAYDKSFNEDGIEVDFEAEVRQLDSSHWPVAVMVHGLTIFSDDIDEALEAVDPRYPRMTQRERDDLLVRLIYAGNVMLAEDIALPHRLTRRAA
jgi:hypothetical protein